MVIVEEGYSIERQDQWKGSKAIMSLRRLAMEDRKRDPLYPPLPPTDAPLEKVRLMLQEINKDLEEHGFKKIEILRGKKI